MKLETKIRVGKAVVWACWSVAAVILLLFLVRLTLNNT